MVMLAGEALLVLLAPWLAQAFHHNVHSRPNSIVARMAPEESTTSRRDLFKAASLTALGIPNAALALAQIMAPAPDQLKQYDLPRNALQDAAFAQGMASGMGSYERAAFPTKQRLFEKMFAKLQDTAEPTVVEVGIGSFPNAPLRPV